MDRHRSTLELVRHDESARALELVRHDETARAPERDWDVTAFELDTDALAPQVVSDTTPQVVYDISFPEVHRNNEESTKERAPSRQDPKPVSKWLLIIMAFVVAIAIAVGAGVGVWRHREHISHAVSTITSPPVQSPTASLNPVTTSSPKSTSAAQSILDDTSLAALVLPGGDRHFFFQDNNGFIRRAVRSASENQWTISSPLNLSSNPKSLTPLTASVYDAIEVEDEGVLGPIVIGLQYVSESHILISNNLVQGNWTPDSTFGNWSTAVDTRSLSFCSIPSPETAPNNSTLNIALLFYENSKGKVSALLQRGSSGGNGSYQSGTIRWVDITSQESRSLPNDFRNTPSSNNNQSTTLYESDTNATFSAPFTSAANISAYGPTMLSYSPNSRISIVATGYAGSTSGPGIFGAGIHCAFSYPEQLLKD
ncbi:MAG: hypothetical protein ASARMPREDX12_006139 [Alectoria sarmentosa]|nr:MAG: hypothetical protein ASARMPREDX12_006139 [Alectoria sarmentosa]